MNSGETITSQTIDLHRVAMKEWRDRKGRVILNVGGVRYETTLQTLRSQRNSLLATMFSEANRSLLQCDPDGSYFFDRNGVLFQHILDFHRTSVYPAEALKNSRLQREFQYWGIFVDVQNRMTRRAKLAQVVKETKDKFQKCPYANCFRNRGVLIARTQTKFVRYIQCPEHGFVCVECRQSFHWEHNCPLGGTLISQQIKVSEQEDNDDDDNNKNDDKEREEEITASNSDDNETSESSE